ncbi:transposable element Tcb1 transposase [Trichonephila clavipes]|nr:transposable element Tcb1 transposase [Trichonephila clavipes]
MGECLSSIKHVVGVRSVFLAKVARSIAVKITPSCCLSGMANNQSGATSGCFYRGRIIGKLEEGRSVTRTAIRGFSSGRPRGTTPTDDNGTSSHYSARRNRRQTAGEIAERTTLATGRPISRFTVARIQDGGGQFARRPVRCVPLTPAHRKAFSVVPEHGIGENNEWGRVLFTCRGRFSLSSDSHRLLIWRGGEAAIIPRTSLKGTGMEVTVFFVWGGIKLGSRTRPSHRRRRFESTRTLL